eukprot:m.40978 g.40978  ORF g.40978 m.40978 type:complete len:174 (-) comp14064_c0_seq1:38-559(-)
MVEQYPCCLLMALCTASIHTVTTAEDHWPWGISRTLAGGRHSSVHGTAIESRLRLERSCMKGWMTSSDRVDGSRLVLVSECTPLPGSMMAFTSHSTPTPRLWNQTATRAREYTYELYEDCVPGDGHPLHVDKRPTTLQYCTQCTSEPFIAANHARSDGSKSIQSCVKTHQPLT